MPYDPVPAGGGSTTSTSTSSADVMSGAGFSASFLVPTGPAVTSTLSRTSPGGAGFPGPDSEFGAGQISTPGPSTVPTLDSKQLLLNLYKITDPTQIADIQTQLRLAGYAPGLRSSGFLDSATLIGYNELLKDTANYYQANPDNPPWTPDSLLAAKAAATTAANASGANDTTSTNTSVSDPLAARQLAKDTFSNNLGRNPNRKEQAAFEAGLVAFERAHPSISRTRSDGLGNSTTSTTQGASGADYANAYTTSTQGLANEQGGQHEVGFVNTLMKMMGG